MYLLLPCGDSRMAVFSGSGRDRSIFGSSCRFLYIKDIYLIEKDDGFIRSL